MLFNFRVCSIVNSLVWCCIVASDSCNYKLSIQHKAINNLKKYLISKYAFCLHKFAIIFAYKLFTKIFIWVIWWSENYPRTTKVPNPIPGLGMDFISLFVFPVFLALQCGVLLQN